MATLAEIVLDCTPEIEWRDSSQWATPHPNDLYSSEVKVYHSAEYTEYVSFHVSGMRLILCKKGCYSWADKPEVAYYCMGEFVPPIASSLSQLTDAGDKIKEYAAYVVAGLRKHGDLRHCPIFESMDDVDDKFNPIP
jgi:hypothetical protein